MGVELAIHHRLATVATLLSGRDAFVLGDDA